jgi:hypothetical protein
MQADNGGRREVEQVNRAEGSCGKYPRDLLIPPKHGNPQADHI